MSEYKTDHEILDWVRLDTILDLLVEQYWFDKLADIVQINCFYNNPSKKSSLNFLRKTPWAKTKVEDLYIKTIRENDER